MTAVNSVSNEPLLEATNLEPPLVKVDQSKRFKISIFWLGVLVGIFIETSVVGASYLVLSASGEGMAASKANRVISDLFWSLFASTLAVAILAYLSNLVRASLKTVDNDTSNHRLDEIIIRLECRFVVGGFMGLWMAWGLTHIILGVRMQIGYSILTVLAALAWWRLMMWCHDGDDDGEEKASALTIV